MSNLNRPAEALLRIQHERSIDRLKELLASVDITYILPILRRIDELLSVPDVELQLSLAIRSFHQGEVDDAFSFIAKAMSLDSTNHQVLRTALFCQWQQVSMMTPLNMAIGSSQSIQKTIGADR